MKRIGGILLLTVGLAAQVFAVDYVLVECDQPVKSKKRGVCVNEISDADFMALSPSISWYYTWHYADTNHAPDQAGMEFIPMVWGDRDADLKGLKDYLRDHQPSQILAINEPNLRGQAFIDPKTTARLFEDVQRIGERAGIPVIGPHMALGSSEGDSIRAYDPIERKEVTYTFMNPFLDAFLDYMGRSEVAGLGTHSYGNFGEFSWMIGMLIERYERRIWVSEFAWWNAPSMEAARDYLIQSVDLMERTPEVAGYAWFKERANDNPKISLLEPESGQLSVLGETYVNMPVHDPKVYYRLPGRLQSESYTTMENSEIGATADHAGFLEMKVVGASSELVYQVAVEFPGRYQLSLRCSTSQGGEFEIHSESGRKLATFRADAHGWQNCETEMQMPRGIYKIVVKPKQAARLNWIEFQPVRP